MTTMSAGAARLTIDCETGLAAPSRQVRSPNADARPAGVVPDLIVIHSISLPPGEFGGGAIEDFFTNRLDTAAHPFFDEIRGLRVSAHFLIDRGGRLTQFVPVTARAWHAGPSCFRGRDACNDFSVGIELEGTDTDPFADAQYMTLESLAWALRKDVPSLAAGHAVGHADIAPERKTDPGAGFDWQRVPALTPMSASP